MALNTQSEIKFSVVVASYNNAPYLHDLFDSLLKQTDKNWELVFADDGSSDDSRELIKQFAKTDSRVKYHFHDNNQGVGAAFRSAVEHSSGELVGMLGADDALTPDAIATMRQAHAKYEDASLINSDCIICDQELRPVERPSPFTRNTRSFIYGINVSNFVTFKRACYNLTTGFNDKMRKAVDHDIYLKLEEVGSVEYVNKSLYLYRQHPKGVSQGNAAGIHAAFCSNEARIAAQKRRIALGLPNTLSNTEFKDLKWHQNTLEYSIFSNSDPARGFKCAINSFRINFVKSAISLSTYRKAARCAYAHAVNRYKTLSR